jgi:hypothetical protein
MLSLAKVLGAALLTVQLGASARAASLLTGPGFDSLAALSIVLVHAVAPIYLTVTPAPTSARTLLLGAAVLAGVGLGSHRRA